MRKRKSKQEKDSAVEDNSEESEEQEDSEPKTDNEKKSQHTLKSQHSVAKSLSTVSDVNTKRESDDNRDANSKLKLDNLQGSQEAMESQQLVLKTPSSTYQMNLRRKSVDFSRLNLGQRSILQLDMKPSQISQTSDVDFDSDFKTAFTAADITKYEGRLSGKFLKVPTRLQMVEKGITTTRPAIKLFYSVAYLLTFVSFILSLATIYKERKQTPVYEKTINSLHQAYNIARQDRWDLSRNLTFIQERIESKLEKLKWIRDRRVELKAFKDELDGKMIEAKSQLKNQTEALEETLEEQNSSMTNLKQRIDEFNVDAMAEEKRVRNLDDPFKGKQNDTELQARKMASFISSDCSGWENYNYTISGVYNISFDDVQKHVYCEMGAVGGAWTIIQKRDGFGPFNDFIEMYKRGFGEADRSYWLGLTYMSIMTSRDDYVLRFDMTDRNGESAYAEYSTFKVSDGHEDYSVYLSGYSGTAGNPFLLNTWVRFVARSWGRHTCADFTTGGWWWSDCREPSANVNGRFSKRRNYQKQGIYWNTFRANYEPLNYMSMKVRKK